MKTKKTRFCLLIASLAIMLFCSTVNAAETTSKKVETSTVKVTMKKPATKTYTKKLTPIRKISTKKDKKKIVETTVLTEKTEKYKKKSRIKTVITKKTTTVKTTTTNITTNTAKPSNPSIESAAPKAHSNVKKAFNQLGFKVIIDPSVSFSGHFDGKARTIVLKKQDDTIYHELGHFVSFIAGNADVSKDFIDIYNSEKSACTCVNKVYVTKTSSEYFAESYRDYISRNDTLKRNQPKTYAYITSALSKITDKQIDKVMQVYGPLWR